MWRRAAARGTGRRTVAEPDGIVREFLIESFENLDQADTDLVTLESSPGDRSLIDGVFRAVHTIKGTCGFLGFSNLETLSHAGEGLLSRLRNGELELTSDIADILLALLDTIRAALRVIDETGEEGSADHAQVVTLLHSCTESEATVAPTPDHAADVPPASAPSHIMLDEEEGAGADDDYGARAQTGGPQRDPAGNEASASSSPSPGDAAAVAPSPEDRNVRVDVSILDALMDLVGELVLTRNELLRQASPERDAAVSSALQHLNLVTTDLQEGVMKTRMQPVGKIWGKFPRMVRDLSQACGKRVVLEMEGQDTELDRSLIEAIRDPLTHLVRNAIDHGIEAPTVRERNGKSPIGHLWLRAFPEGGQVNIEITDDGGGIDAEQIRDCAVANRVLSHEQADRLSRQETLALVFLPGVSTAQRVTNMSGRGVGMDVVKTNIERVNGMVDIDSKPLKGTTINIKIPLTLAIIPAVTVAAAGERFAIPQSSVLELVRLTGSELENAIENIHGAPVYRLRGRLLPIVNLRTELQLEDRADNHAAATIAVLQADDRQFGLLVDSVIDSQEIVVKPLGGVLDRIPVFIGATIMGDGKTALILDVLGLAQRAHVIAEEHQRSLVNESQPNIAATDGAEHILLCRSPDDGRIAIPLEQVARLETLAMATVEHLGEHRVVQYRGDLLPLIDVCAMLPERRQAPRNPEPERASETVQVVVYSYRDHSVGLIVESILDIVEEVVEIQRPSSRQGVDRCAVVRGRITEFLDVDGIVERSQPPFSTPSKPSSRAE